MNMRVWPRWSESSDSKGGGREWPHAVVLTTAPPMIKTAARAPQSILLPFFATGFVVPEVDVAVSMASAAVISFFVSSGFLGCTWSVPRHLAFSSDAARFS